MVGEWNVCRQWIRSMRKGRTIMLSTHFMEEADALSDQIIILSNGRLCANDSSTELKRKYGSGYKLILIKNPLFDYLNLFQRFEKDFENCQIESETKNQLIIQTNEESSKNLIELFNHLDQLKEKELILNYSLSNTTLGLNFISFQLFDKISMN